MRLKTIIGIAIAAALVLGGTALWAANDGGGSGYSASAAPAATDASVVKLGKTQFGNVLVDANGNTLYGFTDDMNATSSCAGSCAQSWPPLTASAAWTVGSGLEQATFHTAMRGDGAAQLVAGKWPLYTFAGDSKPGDVNGQGSLGKWFVVAADGTLIKNTTASSTPSTTAPASSGYGY